MREIISEATFVRGLQIACAAWLVAWVVVALWAGRRRPSGGRLSALGCRLAVACLGPLVYGLWLFYSWMVRYDPRTGYVGLHKVSVVLALLLIFACLGAFLGAIASRLARKPTANSLKPKAD